MRMGLRNWKTAYKMGLLVSILVALNLLTGVQSFRQLDAAVSDVDKMYQDSVLPISSLNKLQNASRVMEKTFMEFGRPGAAADLSKLQKELETQQTELSELLQEVGGSGLDTKEEELVKTMRDSLEQYATTMVPIIQQNAQNNAGGTQTGGVPGAQGDSGSNPFEAGEEILAKLSDAIVEMTEYNASKADAAAEDIRIHTADASRKSLIITIAGVLAAVAAGWFISRQISDPIRRINRVANRVAKGDLRTEKLKLDRKDELGELAGSIDTMVDSLKDLLQRLDGSTDVVGGMSRKLQEQAIRTERAGAAISDSARLTDQGSQEQNVKIRSMVSTLQEMAAAIRMTTATGEEAATAATRSAEAAAKGLQVIGQSVNDMEEVSRDIRHASDRMSELDREAGKISEIAILISEIANQTNLLALNASIEAARAGEHGRGFGVVAAEVRNLAEQAKVSSEHAAEAVKLLQKGTRQAAADMRKHAQKAEHGVMAAREAGAMFREIAQEVDAVTERMTDLSAAMEQAYAGSEEIVSSAENLGILASRSAIQSEQAAGQAEETVAAMKEIRSFSEQLKEESAELERLMKNFAL
ncbi:methyl-accepting chemotaxis protein [Gorillibacterium sp. sgz5001074]|uniref:methyl-accepting chemotaxis protein n=1 Tax=Gorillibacterium sp. sgz5001074 TaxID=3446695 RepID=UPI003F67A2CD